MLFIILCLLLSTAFSTDSDSEREDRPATDKGKPKRLESTSTMDSDSELPDRPAKDKGKPGELEKDRPTEGSFDMKLFEKTYDLSDLEAQLARGGKVNFGPIEIQIQPEMTQRLEPIEIEGGGGQLMESNYYTATYTLPPPHDKEQRKMNFYISNGVLIGSLVVPSDKKNYVAIAYMIPVEQGGGGEVAKQGQYTFEIAEEKYPAPDDFQPQDHVGARRLSRRRRLPINEDKDIYGDEGRPKDPREHAPAATRRTIKLLVAWEQNAWQKFFTYALDGFSEANKKAAARRHWDIIQQVYLNPVYQNLGPFVEPGADDNPPYNADPASVGYDFDVTQKFWDQNFQWPSRNLNDVQNKYVTGELTDQLEQLFDIKNTMDTFLQHNPETKSWVPIYILVTGQSIAGGVASELEGYMRSFTGAWNSYEDVAQFKMSEDDIAHNRYDRNILTGNICGYLHMSVTAWDKGLWNHELGHLLGAHHTHEDTNPEVILRDGYPDRCGTRCNIRRHPIDTLTYINGYFDDNHKGSIMSYCHMCSPFKWSPFFDPMVFWEGELKMMRRGFEIFKPRRQLPNNEWTQGYSTWLKQLDQGSDIGVGDNQATLMFSDDYRCLLVHDGLNGQLQVIVRGKGFEPEWSITREEMIQHSKLKFLANGNLELQQSNGAVIRVIASVGACAAGGCTVKVAAYGGEPRTRNTNCELTIRRDAEDLWRSSEANAARVECVSKDGTAANGPNCVCTKSAWAVGETVTTVQKLYCNEHNVAHDLPLVFGDCAQNDGVTVMNAGAPSMCRCGTMNCSLYPGYNSFCYLEANECLSKCVTGVFTDPDGLRACVCHHDPNIYASKGEYCDVDARQVHKKCANDQEPPCACGAVLCQAPNVCDLPTSTCAPKSLTANIQVENAVSVKQTADLQSRTSAMKHWPILLLFGFSMPLAWRYFSKSTMQEESVHLLI